MSKQRKQFYKLTFNTPSNNGDEYLYEFRNVKNIKLLVSLKGLSIEVYTGGNHIREQILTSEDELFSDAVRKALLLYILKYSKGFKIKTITININNQKYVENVVNRDNPPIYSMINNELVRNIPSNFLNDALIKHVLSTPKSKYDRRTVALFDFVMSKSKEYETEKFIYLWSTFNAMYGWLSRFMYMVNKKNEIMKDTKTGDFKRPNNDARQIKGLQQFYDLGQDEISKDVKSKIANNVISCLKDFKPQVLNRNTIENDIISKRIQGAIAKYDANTGELTGYAYLLTVLSYYLRCEIFHGDKPVILFTYSNDRLLHALRIINALLEEFINDNLPLWFEQEYIDNVIIPKAERIKLK